MERQLGPITKIKLDKCHGLVTQIRVIADGERRRFRLAIPLQPGEDVDPSDLVEEQDG